MQNHVLQPASAEPLLRPALASDAQAIAQLGRSVFSSTFVHETRPEDMRAFLNATYTPKHIAADLDDPCQTFFVAQSAGHLCGFVQVRQGPAEACVSGPRPIELQRLYVDAQWHGRRVAQSLMNLALNWAQQHHYSTVWLGVAQTNARAQRFYEKLGLRVCGEHLFYVGDDPQMDNLMAGSVADALAALQTPNCGARKA